ncbi:MAG: tetratricopeptide repeat protein [Candidatus Omnitrophota bacterium]
MKIAKGILVGLFILLPLIFWSFLYQGYDLPKWFIFRWGLFLIFVIASSCSLAGARQSQSQSEIKVPIPPFLYPLAAFFFFNLLSLSTAVSLYQGLLNIANLVLVLSLYFFVTSYFDVGVGFIRPASLINQAPTLLFLIVLPSLPVALYGICQMFGYDFVHLTGPFRGAISTFGHRNFVAEYLLMLLPLLLYLVFFHSGRINPTPTRPVKPLRIFSLLTLVVVYTHFILTHTRGAYVSLAVALLFLSVGVGFIRPAGAMNGAPTKGNSYAIRLVLTLSVLFCFTVFFLFHFFHIPGEQPIKFKLVGVGFIRPAGAMNGAPTPTSFYPAMPGSLQSRLLIWQASLSAFKVHPVIGVGTGNLPEVLPLYHSDKLKNIFRGRIEAGTSHNEFIQVFAETGILGGISFLLFVTFLLDFTFRLGYRYAKKGNCLPLFLSASILGILVDSIVSSPFQRPVTSFLFWFLVAWSVVLSREEVPGFSLNPKVRDKILFSLTAFLGVSAYYFGYLPFLADFHGRRGLEHYLAGNRNSALIEIEKAVEFQPQDQYLLTLAGNIYLATGKFEKAIESYYRVTVYHPYWFQGYGNLGLALFKAGRFAEAEDYYLYSLKLDPYQPIVHNSLGALYLQTGKVHPAREEFFKALALDPEFKYARWNLEEANKK